MRKGASAHLGGAEASKPAGYAYICLLLTCVLSAYEVCECEGGLPVPSPLAAAAVAARPGFKREPAVRWPRSAQSHPGRHRLR